MSVCRCLICKFLEYSTVCLFLSTDIFPFIFIWVCGGVLWRKGWVVAAKELLLELTREKTGRRCVWDGQCLGRLAQGNSESIMHTQPVVRITLTGKLQMKSTGQTKCRKEEEREKNKMWTGDIIQGCMLVYLHIQAAWLPSWHAPLRGSSERAMARKESPMAASAGTWPCITSHPNTGWGTAWHGTHDNKQVAWGAENRQMTAFVHLVLERFMWELTVHLS